MIDNYFDYFSNTEYDIKDFTDKWNIILSSEQKSLSNVKSLTTFLMKIDMSVFDEYVESYQISDHETPEDISLNFYGTYEYWWMIMVLNKISYFDFPLTQSEIHKVATQLYQSENKFSVDGYKKIISKENNLNRSVNIVKSDRLTEFLKKLYDVVTNA